MMTWKLIDKANKFHRHGEIVSGVTLTNMKAALKELETLGPSPEARFEVPLHGWAVLDEEARNLTLVPAQDEKPFSEWKAWAYLDDVPIFTEGEDATR